MTAPVVVCTWRTGRDEATEEVEAALTLGREVAAALGAEMRWLVLGESPEGMVETAARHGAAGVDRIDHPRLGPGRPDAQVEALARYAEARPARLFAFLQGFETRLVAPRLAARLGAGVVMNVLAADVEGDCVTVTTAAYGGDTRAVYELGAGRPAVVAVLPGAVEPRPADSATDPPVETLDIDLDHVEERVRVLAPAHDDGPRLEDAEIVVSGGRGLGSPENFALVEELAEALGGMAGASRPLVDEGWIDSSRQVGLTGRVTRPALYLAAGISGATQHMVGCSAAKTIVAVNTDPDAAIFRYARYGIVDDCTEVLPEIIRAVRKMGASR